MSQNSIVSLASTIPYEIIENQDDIFVHELVEVDELYFQEHSETENDTVLGLDPGLNIETILRSSSEVDQDDIPDQSHEINFESDNDDENEVSVEVSDIDRSEYSAQNEFKSNGCGCKLIYGKPCSDIVNFVSLVDYREYCKELCHDELDLVIKGQLLAHRYSGPETQAKKHKVKHRERTHQKFYFNGCQVCRQTFCFAHGIARKKLQAIAHSLDEHGLTPRTHGNIKRLPKSSLTYLDRERIKTFICKYARDHALPLPGRLPNFKESHVLLLPTDKSISDIHEEYEQTAQIMSFRSVGLRSFQRIWSELCPYLSVSKPSTDLCQKCQDFSVKLSNGGNLTETEKAEVLEKFTDHVTMAKKQRDYYREQCQQSKHQYSEISADRLIGNKPCSVDRKLHYSWDYAQQVHYPHHSQQTGPMFFKTPRKCNVFGVCSEGSGKQIFYLVDEAECGGKGANEVASMVHHFFSHHGHGEKHGAIHFDNCCGQNKNNVILWYALWRVLNGLHESLELSMMVAGHTKFDPDWHFGLWKRRWRNSNAETMMDIANTVQVSSRSGHNIPQLVQDEDKPVIFYEWRDFFKNLFKPLKNLTQYHHFVITCKEPGVVKCRAYADSEEIALCLTKKNVKCLKSSDMPEITPTPVMDAARQWYLYENIRDFCTSEESKNICCPKPVVPKKEMDVTTDRKMPVGAKRKSLLLK